MKTRRRTHGVLWILQALLALLFLVAGGVKLVTPADELTAQSSLSASFLQFIGVCEVLGAVGLLVPSLTGIRPQLTSLAAAGLVVIMIGATITATLEMGAIQALFPLIVGVLTGWVGYARAAAEPARHAESG